MKVVRRPNGTTYRSATKDDPEFGPVCRCGSRKAKQAFTCQACHNVVRGYGTVPLQEQNRRWRQRYLGVVGVVGDEDPAYRQAQITQAKQTADGELATLIAEQERDARAFRVGSRGMVSLDAQDGYGRAWHERVAS